MKTTTGLALTLAIVWLTPMGAWAADAQVTAPIRDFIAAFNTGDLVAAEATHTADAVIVDEPPPFIWRGPGAFQAWLIDLDKDDKARGRTEGHVTLGATKREEVTGDSAYVIVAADYAFKDKGVQLHEPSQMTYSLRKTAAGWKISSWTWTGPRPMPRK